MSNLAAFLVVAAVVIATPGPDTALTIRNTFGGGRRGGLFTAVGVALGQTTWAVATSVGLAALLLATQTVFQAVRYVGAAYLVFLGVRQFRSRAAAARVGEVHREPAWSMFRRGLLVNLTNPKAVVFFLAFTPQFIRPEQPLLPQYAVLAATIVAIDVVIMWFFFAAAAKGLGRLTQRESGQRTLNRIFGGLFVGVGVLLAGVH